MTFASPQSICRRFRQLRILSAIIEWSYSLACLSKRWKLQLVHYCQCHFPSYIVITRSFDEIVVSSCKAKQRNEKKKCWLAHSFDIQNHKKAKQTRVDERLTIFFSLFSSSVNKSFLILEIFFFQNLINSLKISNSTEKERESQSTSLYFRLFDVSPRRYYLERLIVLRL